MTISEKFWAIKYGFICPFQNNKMNPFARSVRSNNYIAYNQIGQLTCSCNSWTSIDYLPGTNKIWQFWYCYVWDPERGFIWTEDVKMSVLILSVSVNWLFVTIRQTDTKQWALCRIRSHGTELITLGRKLHSGTFKTKESRAGLVRVPLFWKSHCVTCVPA